MRLFLRTLGVGVLANLALFAEAQTTLRVSLSTLGIQGNSGSLQNYLSPDGQFVAFCSWSTNLVPGGTTGYQCYVRSLAANTTELISVNPSGTPGNGDSYNPRISVGGRYVTFSSDASDLVAGDTNGVRDVFLRDRLLGVTVRVSVRDDEAQLDGTSDSSDVTLDALGNLLVVFRSYASNIYPEVGDEPGLNIFLMASQVHLRNVTAGTTKLVSASTGGGIGNGASGLTQPRISADGSHVAFMSEATNLVATDANGNVPDIFVRNLAGEVTYLVSKGSTGQQGSDPCYQPQISQDGTLVAFVTRNAFVPMDTNGAMDVYLRNRITGAVARASVDTLGRQGNSSSGQGDGWGISLSPNGRFIAFESYASNFAKNDSNGTRDVFLRDTMLGKTTLVSMTSQSKPGNAESHSPVVSANGENVSFISGASNLVARDTNGSYDCFVRGPIR